MADSGDHANKDTNGGPESNRTNGTLLGDSGNRNDRPRHTDRSAHHKVAGATSNRAPRAELDRRPTGENRGSGRRHRARSGADLGIAAFYGETAIGTAVAETPERRRIFCAVAPSRRETKKGAPFDAPFFISIGRADYTQVITPLVMSQVLADCECEAV